jgi:hypothetical protein
MEKLIDYGQSHTTEFLPLSTEPLDDDIRISFKPERMNIWREIQIKGGKAQSDVPKKLSKLQAKCANAMFNLFVAENHIKRMAQLLGGKKVEHEELEELLEEMLNEKIEAVQRAKDLEFEKDILTREVAFLQFRKEALTQEVVSLRQENRELKEYIKVRSGG